MKNYKNIFKVFPLPCLLLEPKDGYFFIRDANESYSEVTGKAKEELIGMIIPDVFPENPEQLGNNWKEIHASLNRVLISGKADRIDNLRYDLLIPCLNEYEERYWQVENIPIMDETTGFVNFILYIALDKTLEFHQQRQSLEIQSKLTVVS
ncbi:MAG: PAS domain-containing protein [Flavobacteriaceae bacterium]|nr:PAS domain-containing protein [Flavobacteriaceae bacterium]